MNQEKKRFDIYNPDMEMEFIKYYFNGRIYEYFQKGFWVGGRSAFTEPRIINLKLK